MANKEENFQRAAARLLNLLGWFWWHTPNGGYRLMLEAKRLKLQGVKPGVPDIIICEDWECKDCVNARKHDERICNGVSDGHGVAIELKVGRNKPSIEQVEWIKKARDRGWLTAVCYTMSDVQEVLDFVVARNGRYIANEG